MTPHDHDHSINPDADQEIHGIALGFRIFENQGELYFAEAEISAYVDEPAALGATLVFHRVSGLDPTHDAEDIDWPTWVTEIDDDLTRDENAPTTEQFEAILRQLIALTEQDLGDYLVRAMEEIEEDQAK